MFFSKSCFSIFHPSYFAFNYVFSKMFFYHSIEHAKTQGISCSDFWKSFFYAQKRSPTKFTCSFLAFFQGLWIVETFLAYRMDFFKIKARDALHLCMLYRMVKNIFRKNIVEGKITRMENGSFLTSVHFITSLNLHISGWNFYRRLPAPVLTYPENFSRFGLSLTKIDFWGWGP